MKMSGVMVIGLALSLSACASIVDGSSEEITMNTNPAGADCKFNRKDEVIGEIEKTPGTLLVKKTKDDIKILCSKKGYEDATYLNHSGIDDVTWGNIVLGGFIGWGIDSAGGADNHYDSPVNLTLAKK